MQQIIDLIQYSPSLILEVCAAHKFLVSILFVFDFKFDAVVSIFYCILPMKFNKSFVLWPDFMIKNKDFERHFDFFKWKVFDGQVLSIYE